MIKHGVVMMGVAFMTMGSVCLAQRVGPAPLAWDGSLNSAMALSMFYGEHPAATGPIAQMGAPTPDLFPAAMLAADAPRSIGPRSSGSDVSKDSPGDVQAVKQDHYYVGGEIGAFYGRSSGKFGGDEMGSYLMGTVGNDKFQITAGVSSEESNFRLPRRYRY